MPPKKNKDKDVQPAHVEHADDSLAYSEAENMSGMTCTKLYRDFMFSRRTWLIDPR